MHGYCYSAMGMFLYADERDCLYVRRPFQHLGWKQYCPDDKHKEYFNAVFRGDFVTSAIVVT